MFEYDDIIDQIQENINTLQNDLESLIEGTPAYREIEYDLVDELEKLGSAEREREEAAERMRDEYEDEYSYPASASEILEAANAIGDPEIWQAFREQGDTNGTGLDLSSLSEEAQEYIKESRGYEEKEF